MSLEDKKKTRPHFHSLIPEQASRGNPLPTPKPSPIPTGFIGLVRLVEIGGDEPSTEVEVHLIAGRLGSLDKEAIAVEFRQAKAVQVSRVQEFDTPEWRPRK